MANNEHIRWLLEGVEAWNERHSIVRDREYRFTPDFEDAPLYEIFREAGKLDIRGRIPIAGVDLVDAKLAKANLSFADLTEADLTLADLTDVTLWGASLVGTKLHYTDLTRANLTTSEPWKASLYPSVIRSPKQRPDEAGLVKSIEDLLLRIQVLRDCYGEAVTLYFRGEFECGWDLRPSVMRNDLAAFESGMLVDLMSRRPGEFSGMTSALAQWVLAQHHGLQTRFLDVTRNPLVALFHACHRTGQEDHNEENGRLHVFVVPRTLIKPFNSDAISIVSNVARLSRRQQDALLGKHFCLFHNRIRYENEHLEAMRILYQLIRQEKPYFEERIDPRDLYRVFVVEPQQYSERLRAQSAAFLVSAFHDRFERDEVLKWNEEIPIYAHYGLTVSGKDKVRLMEDLQLLNITSETLFPGLDSTAKTVTKSYTTLMADKANGSSFQ